MNNEEKSTAWLSLIMLAILCATVLGGLHIYAEYRTRMTTIQIVEKGLKCVPPGDI